jgi:hypothetical protein
MNWPYIAGFFDGEGSISHNGKGYRITIPQTNETVLQGILKYTKVGKIIAVAKRKPHWHDAWVYYVAKQTDVERFLRACYPYLVVKRQKTHEALTALPKIPILQQQRTKVAAKHKSSVYRLRARGLTWREIGKRLDIDWGYARRLYLRTKNYLK